jgi:phosphatidyl-myo-inositol dimannoside synthase
MKRMASQRRILLTFTETFADGGIQRFNRTLLIACREAGLKCDVHSLNDATAPIAAANERIRVFGGNRYRFAIRTLVALLFGGYDLAFIGHINFVGLMARGLRLRLGRRPTLLLIAHGVDVWTGIAGQRRRALRAVDLILCVSRYTSLMMQRQAPEIPERRYRIFPNAINAAWWAQVAAEPAAAPSGMANPPARRYLLSVARISRHDRAKGVLTVLEALSMLQDREVHYVIAGHGDDRSFLKRAAERLGVADRVHFPGAVADHDLARLYRHCQAFVLPSGQEGFGIVFLEAMFFGVPVIAAAEKGAIDVVQDEATGLLVRYGDVVSLTTAVDRLLADPELRARLRAQGRAAVTDHGPFTFAAFSGRWQAIVQEAIPGAPATPCHTA